MNFDSIFQKIADALNSAGHGITRASGAFGVEVKYFLTNLGKKALAASAAYKKQRDEWQEDKERRKRERNGRASATGSTYDEHFDRRSKPQPMWLRILGALGTFMLRAVATMLLIFVITGCIVGATSMIYILVYLDKDIKFDLHQLELSYTSVIYVEDGTNEDGSKKYAEFQKLHGSENREWVDYTAIPQYVKDAFVAIEDHRYWTHHGVDWRRTVACFGYYFLNDDRAGQGGSTITQQLIKNVTEEKDVSIDRKLKEIFRALELEQEYTKIEILEAYLNVIALGNGCNGVYTASHTYFNKDVSELTLAEAACLAGITKNPYKYNPLRNPEENKKRQIDVLHEMLEYGFITQEEHDQAVAEELVFNENSVYTSDNKSYNNWYVDQIIYDLKRELQEVCGMSAADAAYTVYNGGLQIYSCMDVDMQQKAESLFQDASNFRKFPGSVQPKCAIAVMNYEGAVKCIVGDRAAKTGDLMFSYASQATRQPGSSFKPVAVYGPAVAYGLLEFSTPVTNRPINLNGKQWPKNAGSYSDMVPVVKGVEVSANCVAVRVAQKLTTPKMFEFLTKRLSFDLIEEGRVNDVNLSTALGGLSYGVTVLDMTASYAVFGNGGVFHEPYTYTKVINAKGETILEHSKADGTSAMSADAATIMNRMLRSPITGSNGTARSAAFGGFPIFGKTGTTSNDVDRYFAGGTPYYVSACWFGYEVQKELSIKNVNHAMRAWKMIMQMAHKGLDNDKGFPSSKNVVSRSYCTVSGGIAGAGCPSSARGYYAKNSSMPVCPIHSGGKATKAFTMFLSSADMVKSESTTVSETTTTTTTTPAPTITTNTSTTTSTTTSNTSTTTTSTTTTSTTTTTTTTSSTTTSSTTTSTTTTTTTTTKPTETTASTTESTAASTEPSGSEEAVG